MKCRFVLPTILIATALSVVPVTRDTPAEAAPAESGLAIVANQNASASCPTSLRTTLYDDHVILARPLDGALVQDLLKPATISGRLNEAKPFANNTKIVALWGPSGGNPGGVGVFTRTGTTTGSWTTAFSLPTNFEGGDNLAHSVTVLPGSTSNTDSFAVAQTGAIGGVGTGYVVVFDHNGALQKKYDLTGAHGVEWDTEDSVLYAVGRDHLKSYKYDPANFTLTDANPAVFVPKTADGKRGGHDLRRRREDDRYFVTADSAAWLYDPDTNTFGAEVLRGGARVGGVKSLDQRFDLKTEMTWWPNPAFYFFETPWEKPATFCMRPYKVRWIYGLGEPVYQDTVPDDAEVDPTLPFVWEKNLVRTDGPDPLSGQIWVGGAAGHSPAATEDDINEAYDASPMQVPYIQFYQWGDSGPKVISKVHEAGPVEWQKWKDQANAIVRAVGDREGYVVVEPEWDANIDAHCTTGFAQTLREVIGILNGSEHLKILNGVGLWNGRDQDFIDSCFVQQGLNRLFDAHGVTFHLLSNDSHCTERHWSHSKYNSERWYTGGWSYDDAIKEMTAVGTKKLDRVKRLFGGDVAYLTDLMVTSCGWEGREEEGQEGLVKNLVDQLTTLYKNNGFRGVSFRDHGPGVGEMYTGVGNESNLDYATKPAGDEVVRGRNIMTTFMASLDPTAPQPEFSVEVTGPTNVTPGSQSTYQVKVTCTAGSLSDGIIDLEIYPPSGQHQQFKWEHQSWLTGQSVSKTQAWTAPVTPGTYTFKAGVFDAVWTSPPFEWNDSALLVQVGTGESTFSSTATATPPTVGPGASSNINVTVTNTSTVGLTDGNVDVEVRDPDGLLTGGKGWTGQNIPAGTPASFPLTWTAPAKAGTYTVVVVVTDATRAKELHRNAAAGTVSVSSSRFTTSATASRAVVRPSGATTVTATVRNDGPDALSNGVVEIQAYAPDGTLAAQQAFTGANLAVGATQTYPWTWTVPATQTTYTIKIVVSGPGGTPVYHRNANAATVRVTPPAFTVTAAATPAKVQPGGPLTISVAVTNTGGGIDNGVVDVEVYTAANAFVDKKFWENEPLLNGETRYFTWSRTAPATLGTYTMKLGVFGLSGTTWTPQYKWVESAGTFDVAKPAFTSAADVSSSSVTPGTSVTITASFTNTAGAMTNGNVLVDVYNSAGSKVGGKAFNAVSIGSGETKQFVYTWPGSASPGTYRVKLGVFDSVWTSPGYHWADNAATINVGATSFVPSFRVGDGANSWWVEVYTSSDVTAVDVIGDNGRIYFSLEKKTWAPNVFAARPPSELLSGQLVQFVARRSTDGATAGSNNFGWLTQTPVPESGWVCAVTKGSGSSTTWVEASACATATAVYAKVGTGAFTLLTYSSTSLKWGKAMSVPAGSKVVFRAHRSDGAKAYSVIYTW